MKRKNEHQNQKIFQILKKRKLFSTFALYASSQSMWPLIDSGDKVTGIKVRIESLQPNEIIIFYSPKIAELVIHRVVNFAAQSKQIKLVTKGDNNLKIDLETVSKRDFLGKALTIQKENKKIYLEKNLYPLLGNRKNIIGKVYRKLFFYFFDKPGLQRLI